MGLSAMFTYQLDIRKHCRYTIAVMGVIDMFGHSWIQITNQEVL